MTCQNGCSSCGVSHQHTWACHVVFHPQHAWAYLALLHIDGYVHGFEDLLPMFRMVILKGGMMEEWHQKLHNNTTPDEVGI